MNSARIVVLTIALVAGGAAAYPASGSDNKPLPTEPVVRLQTVDEISPETGSLALRSNGVKTSPDDQFSKRGDSVNVADYGVSTPTRTLK
jgi:hypothetical protein